MGKLFDVVRVELLKKTVETVIKTRRHDYSRGGYRVEETILRVTSEIPRALLSCGHWRKEYNSGAVVRTAKKLSCFECEKIERESPGD